MRITLLAASLVVFCASTTLAQECEHTDHLVPAVGQPHSRLPEGESKDDRAIASYTEAIRVDPKNACVYHAIDDLTEAIAIDPKDASYLSFRAECWVDKKEYDKAIEDNSAALKIDPTSTFAFVSRAQCWVHKKDWDRAISDYSAAIESDPTGAGSFCFRGLCWLDKGTYGEALYDFLQASIIDPKDAAYLDDLARLYATCPVEKYRDGQKAIEFAVKACELDSWKEAGHIDTLAAAYAEAGNFEKAVEWQTKAIEIAPKEEQNDVRAHLELFKSRKPYRLGP